MSGIFPEPADGGLPHNAADLSNPKASYPPVTPPLNTAALYYGNGCDVRLRPEVVNSLISEVEATVDQAGLAYNPAYRENLELAIRYLIQRGLQTGAHATLGPNDYVVTLDPVITGYNDFMTLVIIPAVDNQGAVRLNVNGRGLVPLLRNDRQQLEYQDLKAGIPTLISYIAGYWFHVGLCSSQVPIIAKGAVDVWIRTDGNDTTGDGSVNTAAKAFRTINGAWKKVGGRYAATPQFSINMRLGIPGDYEAGIISNFGGFCSLSGDPNSPDIYRIMTGNAGVPTITHNLSCTSVGSATVVGVCFVQNQPQNVQHLCLNAFSGATVAVLNCTWDAVANNTAAIFLSATSNSTIWLSGTLTFRGNGFTMAAALSAMGNSGMGCADVTPALLNFRDSVFSAAGLYCQGLGQIGFTNVQTIDTNNTGREYVADTLSVITAAGRPLPGNLPGIVSNGGIFVP